MKDEFNGLRKTTLHVELLKIFKGLKKPINASALMDKLISSHDQASLYRALNRFIDKKMIKVVYVHEKNGAYYELSEKHDHYILCRECGKTKALESCSIHPMISKAKELGFQNIEHRLELTGRCEKCV